MNVWLFMFTDQKYPIASARIAADSKQEASVIAKERVMGELLTKGRIVVSHMGHAAADRPGVMAIDFRRIAA